MAGNVLVTLLPCFRASLPPSGTMVAAPLPETVLGPGRRHHHQAGGPRRRGPLRAHRVDTAGTGSGGGVTRLDERENELLESESVSPRAKRCFCFFNYHWIAKVTTVEKSDVGFLIMA